MQNLRIPFKKILFVLLILVYSVQLAQAGDEAQINEQLQNGNVLLEARTYTLTDSIILQSDRVLEGEPGTVITIPNNVGWAAWKPLVSGIRKQNITVKNIEFNGNADNQNVPHGKGYHNFIHVIDCDSVIVSSCLMHDSKGDGLRAKTSTNIKFYDNTAYRLGHDVFYGIDSQNILCYNNRITTRTNSALRIWNSAHVRFNDNIIDAQQDSLGGNPGIQVEDSKGVMQDIEICNNVIKKTWGSFLWLIAYDSGTSNTQSVNIHHNLVYQAATSYNIPYAAGVTISGQTGTQITNNVFDGVHNAAVLALAGGQSSMIQDNIITDTREHTGIYQAGTGCGVVDRSGASFSILNNCFFSNQNGNLYKCISSRDDLADPKTHNTSSGWTWNGQTWVCDRVAPADMGTVAPTNTNGTVDTDTHEFNDIFDILDVEFTDNGITNQPGAGIQYSVQQTEAGRIAGGIKIIGFRDLINIDNVSYIPNNDSVLVKYEVVKAPSYSWNNTGVSKIDKNVSVKIEDGNATATLTVKMKWFKLSTDSTGTTKKKYKASAAIFTDTVKAPNVLQRPSELRGILYEYPTHSVAYVPSDGLTQVEYEYDGKTVKHVYLLGEQHTNDNGITYTNFSQVNYWKGDLPHSGEFLFINGSFDPEKLTVTAYTPYENFEVTHFDYVKKDFPDKVIADWLYPSFGLFLILGFGAWYYIRKILY